MNQQEEEPLAVEDLFDSLIVSFYNTKEKVFYNN
jgi:hypothetical protein